MMVRERGVAVVTALLLTTLAVTAVSSLFWQQQVQLRSIENQRFMLQTQWILRGALDWARLVLSEDAMNSTVDHIDESWAKPLPATKLADYMDVGGSDQQANDAVLSGSIVDAQSRYNLKNLAPSGALDQAEVAVLRRLLAALHLNPALAVRIADAMVSKPPIQADQISPVTGVGNLRVPSPRPANIEQVEDLLALPGITLDILEKLREFIVVLPHPTPINLNTASAQLLAAKMNTLSADQVNTLVASRRIAYFHDNDVRLPDDIISNVANFALTTSYFLVNRKLHLNRTSMEVQALLERNPMTGSRTVWIVEK
jgi:general secretion pathway protein K